MSGGTELLAAATPLQTWPPMRNINAGVSISNWRSASGGRQGHLRWPTEHGTRKTEHFNPMTVAIAEFWKLAVESRLLKPVDCQRLEAAFAHVKGAANQGNAATLGEWLVASGALSRYQVQTLLASRPG